MRDNLSALASSGAYPQACASPSSSISILLTASPDWSPCLQFPPSTKSFQEAQSQLNQAAAGLNQSANELVQASRGTPQDLAKSSGKFGQDFNEFLQAGVEMASQSPVRASAPSGDAGWFGMPERVADHRQSGWAGWSG